MMRLGAIFVVALSILAVVAGTAHAQCQRGGRGGPNSARQSPSFAQAGLNPMTFQQVALQRQMQFALRQQQVAMQQFRFTQVRAQQQGRQEKLARRRTGAEARRAETLANRERTRQENLARLETQESPRVVRGETTELVSLGTHLHR